MFKKITLLLIPILILSCGKGTIEIDNSQYKPKIVINGYIYPTKPIDKISITRNFPIGTNLRNYPLIIGNAKVSITRVEDGDSRGLFFMQDSGYYTCMDKAFLVEYNKEYRLDVAATVDGKNLTASSVTKVPKQGFQINSINYDSLFYFQKKADGQTQRFNVSIERSEGTNYYFAAILAQNTSLDNIIYDNAFQDIKREDLKEGEMFDYIYNYSWIQDTPLTAGQSNIELFWYLFWFYEKFKVIVYAADDNFRLFAQTHENISEMDGNYHEPLMNIQGDGIGVFGSMICDTVEVFVKKPVN